MPTKHVNMGNNLFVTERHERNGYDIVKDSGKGWFIEENNNGEIRRSITYDTSNEADVVVDQAIIEWADEWGFISNMYVKLDHDKDTIEHIKRVRVLCRKFINAGLNVDCDLLLLAAGLHDIAKEDSEEKHHEEEKVKKALKEVGIKKEDRKKYDEAGVFEIIEAHKKDFCPSEHQMEAAILRVCDKLDKFDKAKDKKKPVKKAIEAMGDYAETMKKIYKDFEFEANMDDFDEFYQVSQTLLQQQVNSFSEFMKHHK